MEVRMDESHLQPAKVDTSDSVCSNLCDKIMKNMVLTLTILGKSLFSNLILGIMWPPATSSRGGHNHYHPAMHALGARTCAVHTPRGSARPHLASRGKLTLR